MDLLNAYIPSICYGLSVACLVLGLGCLLSYPPRPPVGALETERRQACRQASSVFKASEGLVLDLASLNAKRSPSMLADLNKALTVNSPQNRWLAEEYLAINQVVAIVLAAFVIPLAWYRMSFMAIFVGVGLVWMIDRSGIASQFGVLASRMKRIRARLPFAIDLMALMMGAGASFSRSMETVAIEEQRHPLGQEFQRIVSRTEVGKLESDLLAQLRNRLNDSDINDFVLSVTRSTRLGTDLGEVLQILADQMRLRRSQSIEKLAGQAQVKMTYPSLLIMMACIAIISAPFLLRFLESYDNGGSPF